MAEFREALEQGWTQVFRVDEVLVSRQTDYQALAIFTNPVFGRVMTLDGIVQTTERDEFIYHEMLAQVPLLAHGAPRRVLIIGGGDGGTLREVLKHANVEHATMVEIDAGVVDAAREFLPNHSRGAFDDPRAELIIGDGIRYVLETRERFDVIVCDSTDPVGPGEALFTPEFYRGCRGCLREGGVLATQNGTSFDQFRGLVRTAQRLGAVFADFTYYLAAIPSYQGGDMAFAWATDDRSLRETPVAELRRRFEAAGIETRYYTPEIHLAAFALPPFIEGALRGVEFRA